MAQVNLICSVRTNGADLYIRSGPSLSNQIIGMNSNGTGGIHVTQEENGWYYLVDYGGWSSAEWMNIDQNLGNSIQTPSVEEVVKNNMTIDQQLQAYKSYAEPESVGDITNLITTSLEGIYGAPYQFMPSVDPKLDGTRFGSLYADKIIARMPLLLLAPGKVNFMRDFKTKNDAAKTIMSLTDSDDATDFNNLNVSGGRYYTFDYDYAEYYKYVNAMCMTGAYFLGIENVKIKNSGEMKPLKSVDWGKAGTNCFKKILSAREYVAFYVDSASQSSNSFDNSTTESQLGSKINSFSDTGRELNFLLGVTTGKQFFSDKEDAIETAMQTVSDISKKYLNGNQLFTDIGKNFATVAVGGKLVFPEIWSDSSYSSSYDVNIKLRTPDGDKLSWFLNIFVPLAHLICLTAPRSASDSGPNGYTAPFLVRGFYKGLWNCDTGIITGLDISRGREKGWTLDRLPTEVDVSVQIKDLYNMMTLSSYTSPGAFVNNITLMDYIANSCGININEPDFIRSIEVYCMLNGYKLSHTIPDIWYTIQQDIGNRAMSLQQKMTKFLGVLDKIPVI